MKVLTAAPEPRADRPATMLLHDEANSRIVAFRLLPGQVVPAHRSDSTVTVHVVEGEGIFLGEDGEAVLRTGQAAVFAPGEMHAIEAGVDPLHFIAIITPRPGG